MHLIRRVGTVAVWFLQALLALAFTLIGVAKFADPSWARSFARWGYPDGFYLVVGVLEAAGGLALLVPRLASWAAVMLGAIMLAASVTHFVHGEMNRVTPPLMYLAVVAIVGLARRRAAWRPRVSRRAVAAGPM